MSYSDTVQSSLQCFLKRYLQIITPNVSIELEQYEQAMQYYVNKIIDISVGEFDNFTRKELQVLRESFQLYKNKNIYLFGLTISDFLHLRNKIILKLICCIYRDSQFPVDDISYLHLSVETEINLRMNHLDSIHSIYVKRNQYQNFKELNCFSITQYRELVRALCSYEGHLMTEWEISPDLDIWVAYENQREYVIQLKTSANVFHQELKIILDELNANHSFVLDMYEEERIDNSQLTFKMLEESFIHYLENQTFAALKPYQILNTDYNYCIGILTNTIQYSNAWLVQYYRILEKEYRLLEKKIEESQNRVDYLRELFMQQSYRKLDKKRV